MIQPVILCGGKGTRLWPLSRKLNPTYTGFAFQARREYDNAIAGVKFNIIQGVFPSSMENVSIKKPISFAHIDVDTYISAKESFDFIMQNATQNALVILDDYGGWFTDGVTKFGNELESDKRYFVVPNHLGQLLIYKID